jgi:excisionase family DNA binding protein
VSSLDEIFSHAPHHGDDQLLTPAEAAKRIGVSHATVCRWLRDDAIPYEPIGPKRKRIRASVAASLSPRSTRNIPV